MPHQHSAAWMLAGQAPGGTCLPIFGLLFRAEPPWRANRPWRTASLESGGGSPRRAGELRHNDRARRTTIWMVPEHGAVGGRKVSSCSPAAQANADTPKGFRAIGDSDGEPRVIQGVWVDDAMYADSDVGRIDASDVSAERGGHLERSWEVHRPVHGTSHSIHVALGLIELIRQLHGVTMLR